MQWEFIKGNKRNEHLHVHWKKEATRLDVHSIDEYNSIVEILHRDWADGFVDTRNQFCQGRVPKTYMDEWLIHCKAEEPRVMWCQDYQSNNSRIFVAVVPEGFEWEKFDEWQFWWIDFTSNMANGQEMTGSEAIGILSDTIKEDTGKSLQQWIGGIVAQDLGTNNMDKVDSRLLTGDTRLMWRIKTIMPPRLQWVDPTVIGSIEDNYQKADYSSAYPSNALRLPTWNECLVKPFYREVEMDDIPEGYNYAIDLELGYMLIKDEGLDTRVVEQSPMWQHIGKDKETPYWKRAYNGKNYIIHKILFLKDSGLDYKPYWDKFYANRKDDRAAKTVMVASIGTLESCQFGFAKHFAGYAALAIYWRHIAKMAKLYEELVARDQDVIQFAIDSIGWLGSPQPDLVDSVKGIGTLAQEFSDSKVCIKANGVYAVESPDGSIQVRAQGTHLPDDLVLNSIDEILTVRTYQLVRRKHNENGVKWFVYERKGALTVGNHSVMRNFGNLEF